MLEKEEQSSTKQWLIIFGSWTLYGIFCGNQTFFEMTAMKMHHPYGRMMLWAVAVTNSWALLTPTLFVVAKRFPFEKSRLLVSIPAHLASLATTWVVISAMKTGLTMLIHPFDPLTSTSPFVTQFREGLVGEITNALFIYAVVIGIGHAIEYRRMAREKALRAAQLEALLSQAQVLSLKMQLHPHFLFNTLNGIVALVRDGDNANAVKMLLGLSNMLRYALDSSGRQEVPLSEEMEFLNLYLGVEQMRFPDRLQVQLDIARDTEKALVPSLMLQPLVENAIRHGIGPRLSPGCVRIAARRDREALVIDVEDDGVGLSEAWTEGIGLANTRARLEQLYPQAFAFQISERLGGGVRVSVSLPWRVSEQSTPEPLLAKAQSSAKAQSTLGSLELAKE